MDQDPYENLVGSFMYDMVYTQLDIAHAMEVLKRYMLALVKEHWESIKKVFEYLHGTIDFAIYYHRNYEEVRFHGFINSN